MARARHREDRDHALPSRSRRRRGGTPRRDGRDRLPGRARLRAVRARLGLARLAGADRRLVPHARRPRGDLARADRAGARVRVVRPFRARPEAAVRGERARTAGGSSSCRGTRTVTSAFCATASSSAATTCSRGSRRPSASIPRAGRTRSATTSRRWSGRPSSTCASSIRVTASRSRTRPGGRARSSSTTASGWTSSRPRSPTDPRSGFEVSLEPSSAPSSRRSSAVSPSPRRFRTSSGSCARAGPRAAGTPRTVTYTAP